MHAHNARVFFLQRSHIISHSLSHQHRARGSLDGRTIIIMVCARMMISRRERWTQKMFLRYLGFFSTRDNWLCCARVWNRQTLPKNRPDMRGREKNLKAVTPIHQSVKLEPAASEISIKKSSNLRPPRLSWLLVAVCDNFFPALWCALSVKKFCVCVIMCMWDGYEKLLRWPSCFFFACGR
jgi:hypothetical protein